MALAAISAVDVFVYDTSLDSDGGAWINGSKARASSWYNETLNTATRGATRAFPAQAMIIAEAAKVTIYDATDPDLPMWMVFNRSAGNPLYFDASATISSLSMINGLMMVGQADSAGVLSYFSMLADRAYLKVNSAPVYNDVTIANRNRGGTLTTYSTDSGAIVNRIVNDVAMTVLADAPIDAATGLQVPTIAVATNGGTSVINNDGTVIDLTLFSRAINKVTFDESGNGLWVASGRNAVHYYETLPTSDSSSEPAIRLITSGYSSPNIGGGFLGDAIEAIEGGAAISSTLLGLVNFLPYGSSSLTGGSMLSYGASTYNTGWMHGDIKGAWLSSVDATDLVNGGTDPDRSVNATDLDVTGTITKTAVANGAELMAYSGFSASNYLEQPYNSDLDFGTGDFHVMWWAKATDATAYMIHRFDATAYFRSRFSSGVIEFRTTGGNISTPDAYNDGAWHLVCGVRSSGVLSLYVDGVVRNSVADTANLDDATASLSIGVSSVQTSALTNGSLALLRIGAGAPTAAQVLKAYNDELPLFQENGAATIFGASNAVTALAHDPDTDLLHVGTSAGRSVFRGLERINNTSTSISTAISASGGLIVEK
jgi:hypothetical protein